MSDESTLHTAVGDITKLKSDQWQQHFVGPFESSIYNVGPENPLVKQTRVFLTALPRILVGLLVLKTLWSATDGRLICGRGDSNW